METKKRWSKQVLSGVLAVAAVFVLSAAGIYAYLTNSEQATNSFTVANNESKPKEEFEPPDELVEGTNSFQKAVCVSNTGTVDCYARVKVEFSKGSIAKISGYSSDSDMDSGDYYSVLSEGLDSDIEDGSGDVVIYAESYTENLPDGWVYISEDDDEDLGGYYYYTEILAPDEESGNLFNYVRSYFADEDDIVAYDIYVYVESIETRDKNGELFTGDDIWRQAWEEFLASKD